MNNWKKKLLAGILSGAIIFTGGFAMDCVQAQPSGKQHQEFGRHNKRPQISEEKISEHSKEFAERFGVNQTEIENALKNRASLDDVKNAAILSKLSGKSFSEVFEMKTDWRQVAEKLGVTHEQFKDYMKNEMLESLVKRSKLDQKTVENLLKEKYNPHDITIAGIIANESGKNVKSVISKRKINNTWEDVAKEFNVDLNKFKNERRHDYKD